MVVIINGEEYLSAGEAAQYLDVSSQTFTKFQKDFKLQSMSKPGMGRTKFFKKKDLEPLKEYRPTTNANSEADSS